MLEALLALLLGLLIGSFLNVCIFRMPNDYSVVSPRSYCPGCRRPIAWYDNIPLLSFILLGGRCRECRGRISLRYPAVEALTGAAFFVIVYLNGPTLSALKLCTFAALAIGLIVLDLVERILPDEFTITGVALGLIFAVVIPFENGFAGLLVPAAWGERAASVVEAAVGAIVAGGMLWVVGRIYLRVRRREGLGGGDPRMVAMIGAFLGLHGALAAVLLGSILGSVLGLSYILLTRKDSSTYELPFGSFLGFAALVIAVAQRALWF
jgi:leader peptidase (prepilin peptidase)/N-methyltransferase